MGRKYKNVKRVKQVFPRRYEAGYINVYGGLDKNPDHPFSFANRGKAAVKTTTEELPDGTRRRILAPIPTTMELTIARAIGDGAVPRAVVLYKTTQSDRLQNPEPWHPICLQDGRRVKLTLWFSGKQWLFVREKKFGIPTVERSIIYADKATALRRLQYDDVVWCKATPILSLPEYPRECTPPPV